MRIIHVINGLGPGGAERSLAELLNRYEKAGVESWVACLKRRNEGVEGDVLSGHAEVRFLPNTGWARRFTGLRRLLCEVRPSLLHTTLFEADILGRAAAAGTDVPVLTSLVNTTYGPARLRDPNVQRRKLAVVRELDGLTARHLTSHFHALTEAVKISAIEALHVKPELVSVVGRGRDPERLGRPSPERRAEVRHRLGIDPAAKVVLSVGRQEEQKDHATLLAALKLMVDRPGLLLLLAGRTGHATPTIQRLAAEPRLEGRVRLLGHRDDVPDLLATADLFAFPSIYEGFGGALIEAMALGLPIVATSIPAVEEVVERGANADLVPPSDPDALARAIAALLDDTDRAAAYGRRSLALFAERFTLERTAEQMLDLYRRVVDAGR